MSDNDFNAPRFKKGHSLTAEKLNKLTDGVRSSPMRRNFGGLTRNTAAGQSFVPHANGNFGGARRPLVMLTGDSDTENIGEFLGDVIDNRTDRTVLVANVTIWAPQLQGGTLPTSGDDVTRFWRADQVDNSESIANAAGGDAPLIVYEIQPGVWI